MEDLEALIRQYDLLFESLNSASQLGPARRLRFASSEEEFLLGKVTSLEAEKQRREAELENLSSHNCSLKQRVESLSKENKAIAENCHRISERERRQFEDLKLELAEAKLKLRESEKRAQRLQKENSQAFLSLSKLELALSQSREEAQTQLSKSREEIEDLKANLARQREKASEISIRLDLKRDELCEAQRNLRHFENELRGVSQIGKSDRARIRSLENERRQLRKKAADARGKWEGLKRGFQELAGEVRRRGLANEKIEELIAEHWGDADGEVIFENLSVDSYVERKLELSKSIKEIEEEFRNKDVRRDLEEIQSFERTIGEIAKPNLEKLAQPQSSSKILRLENPADFSKPRRGSACSGAGERSAQSRKSSKKYTKMKLKKINVTKIKNEAEEQIEFKIKTRSMKRKHALFFPVKRASPNESATQKSYDVTCKASGRKTQMAPTTERQGLQEELFAELKKVRSEVFDSKDQGEFRESWASLRSPAKFVVWTIYFFEFKFKNINLKRQSLEAENGGLTRAPEQPGAGQEARAGAARAGLRRAKEGLRAAPAKGDFREPGNLQPNELELLENEGAAPQQRESLAPRTAAHREVLPEPDQRDQPQEDPAREGGAGGEGGAGRSRAQ